MLYVNIQSSSNSIQKQQPHGLPSAKDGEANSGWPSDLDLILLKVIFRAGMVSKVQPMLNEFCLEAPGPMQVLSPAYEVKCAAKPRSHA